MTDPAVTFRSPVTGFIATSLKKLLGRDDPIIRCNPGRLFIAEALKLPAAEAALTDESLKRSAAHVHGLGRLGDIAVVAGERACQVLPGEIAHHLTSHVLKAKFLKKRI